MKVVIGQCFAASPQSTRQLIWKQMYWDVIRKKEKTPLTAEEQQEKKDDNAALKAYWEKSDNPIKPLV